MKFSANTILPSFCAQRKFCSSGLHFQFSDKAEDDQVSTSMVTLVLRSATHGCDSNCTIHIDIYVKQRKGFPIKLNYERNVKQKEHLRLQKLSTYTLLNIKIDL